MSAHTPGPWTVWHDYNVIAGTRVVAGTGGVQDSSNAERCHQENCANARLIAAAPEMLEALRVLSEEADGFNVAGVYFNEPCMGHKGLKLAYAAIAKAEGRS